MGASVTEGVPRGHGWNADFHTFVQHANIMIEGVVRGYSNLKLFTSAGSINIRRPIAKLMILTVPWSSPSSGHPCLDSTKHTRDSSQPCVPVHFVLQHTAEIQEYL